MKHISSAEAVDKARAGHTAWLEAECGEGNRQKPGRPAEEVTEAGVRAPIVLQVIENPGRARLLWHRRETSRTTEKTNTSLNLG